MTNILILADDVTGAADTGAQFSLSGYPTVFVLNLQKPLPPASVLVITSESRALAQEAAYLKVQDILQQMQSHKKITEFDLLYKKIDSTLRGNPAHELRAFLAAAGEQRAVIAPAFPAQGRTTRQGMVWIHGVPFKQSSFSCTDQPGDLAALFDYNPVLLSLETLRKGEKSIRSIIHHHSQGYIIADAETDDDLRAIAQAALAENIRVFCGSAGLAAALTHFSDFNPSRRINATPPALRCIPARGLTGILAVAGSTHAATAAQIALLKEQGIIVITPPDAFFQKGEDAGLQEISEKLLNHLSKNKVVVLSTAQPANNHRSGTEVSEKLAQLAADALLKVAPRGIFLTGGDTALAVCQAFGIRQLWLGGEVEPGIPWSLAEHSLVVTKAGGFGQPDAIFKSLNWMQSQLGRNPL